MTGRLLVHQSLRNFTTNQRQGDWLLAPSAHKSEVFTKTDVLITGYTFIIFMLRKVGIIGPHLTNSPTETPRLLSPLVLEASRRVIEMSIDLCHLFPYPEGLSMVLVYYRIDIATALLYSHVLHSTDENATVEDMQRLLDLSRCVFSIAHGCRELAPIGRAMEALNKMVTDHGVST